MGKDSTIEWTHHTFNPWWGCARVSPGCKHCYADAQAKRFGHNIWGAEAPRRQLSDNYWKQPLVWNADAAAEGARKRVFCASMADVFEDRADLEASRARLWRLIDETPRLDWLLLTKRPENVGRLVPWGGDWPANVWLGATAENQKWLERRAPHLLSSSARVLFLSCEPLLGGLDLSPIVGPANRGIDWLIGGGESGPRARPMHPDWLTSLRDQSVEAGIKFLFKQWGEWRPVYGDTSGYSQTQILTSAKGTRFTIAKLGKKRAGRMLNGQTWDEIPDVDSLRTITSPTALRAAARRDIASDTHRLL
jgi:protein gp37